MRRSVLISVFSPKGGVGTTVASVLIGQACSRYSSTFIVDACRGDVDNVVGMQSDAKYCFDDWMCSPEPSSTSLCSIAVTVIENLNVVVGRTHSENEMNEQFPRAFQREISYEKRRCIVNALVQMEGHCVVDLGTELSALNVEIAQASDVVVMVLRECYLALARAIEHPLVHHVDACVIVQENGRSISVDQIVDTLSLTTVIEVDARRDFARCIDAGVLIHRTPARLMTPISNFVSDIMNESSELLEEQDINREFWSDNDTSVSTRKSKPDYKHHVTSILRGSL